MKELIKRYSLSLCLAAVLGLVIGILLLVYPEESLLTAARFISAVVMVMGMVFLATMISQKNVMGSIVAAVVAIMGVWLFVQPDIVVKIIPIIVGVILVVCGVQDLTLAVEGIKKKSRMKFLMLFIAMASIAMGVLCIVNAFGIMEVGTRIIGVMIILNALSDVYMSIHMGHVRVEYEKSSNVVSVQRIEETDEV